VPKQTVAASRGPRNGKRGDPRVPQATRRSRSGSASRGAKAPPEAVASEAAPGGAATLTEGLDPLDRERASSLADEGGTAAAAVEGQSPHPPRR